MNSIQEISPVAMESRGIEKWMYGILPIIPHHQKTKETTADTFL